MTRLALLVWLCLQIAPAQTNPQDLLKKIQLRVADSFSHLPNYTCRQTVERFSRPGKSKHYVLEDRLRLDVALIEGDELYAWPGSSKFEEKGIFEVVGGGAIGSGNFALHIRNLFLKSGAQFTFVGKQEIAGRKALRFDYRMPLEKSGFTIRVGDQSAIVDYHGSIWADDETFDLVRLEANVDKIPPELEVTRSADVIEYGRVRIGSADFMLPKAAEMTLFSPIVDKRNVTRFEGCRQYVGESVVSFTDPQPAAATPKPVQMVNLPAGLAVDMTLETPIDRDTFAVGDALSAVLARPVRRDRQTLLPKGARFKGRITRIQRYQAQSLTYHVLGVTFETVETDGLRGPFSGVLESAGADVFGFHVPYTRDPGARLSIWTRLRHETPPPKANEGVFYVRGEVLKLTSGTRLLWTTAAPVTASR